MTKHDHSFSLSLPQWLQPQLGTLGIRRDNLRVIQVNTLALAAAATNGSGGRTLGGAIPLAPIPVPVTLLLGRALAPPALPIPVGGGGPGSPTTAPPVTILVVPE